MGWLEQQVTEIAWFAGLADGEGCFTLDFSANKHRKHPKVNLFFCIGMSPGRWIDRVTHIFKDLGIPHHTKIKKRTGVFEICVSSNKSVKKICEAIYPYVIVKRNLIAEFIKYPGLPKGNQHILRSESDIRRVAQLINFVRAFNRKKNIPYKWDGDKFLRSYGIEP